MAKKDPRLDAYIARSAAFARPILRHLRQVVHEACPEVEETIKWSMPAFSYYGLLCGMAAFKAHATFGFQKVDHTAGERRDPDPVFDPRRTDHVRATAQEHPRLGRIQRKAGVVVHRARAEAFLQPHSGRVRVARRQRRVTVVGKQLRQPLVRRPVRMVGAAPGGDDGCNAAAVPAP